MAAEHSEPRGGRLVQASRQPPRAAPPIISCVTGAASYDGLNVRDTLIRWVDHPQLLWDVISETLVAGVELVIHVGPAPNLIPATFERLSNNVGKQFGNRYMRMIGQGVGSRMNRHSWLSRLLPTKAALLARAARRDIWCWRTGSSQTHQARRPA